MGYTEGSVYKANINIKLKLPNLLGQGSDDKLFIEPKRGARTLSTIYSLQGGTGSSVYGVKQINKQRDI